MDFRSQLNGPGYAGISFDLHGTKNDATQQRGKTQDFHFGVFDGWDCG
jgi:hypothetical protein